MPGPDSILLPPAGRGPVLHRLVSESQTLSEYHPSLSRKMERVRRGGEGRGGERSGEEGGECTEEKELRYVGKEE